MPKIAIFASGTGTNARNIIEVFKAKNSPIETKLIISNKPTAPVLEMAAEKGIETILLKRKSFYDTENLVTQLQEAEIDLVVLAGFLWLIPSYLVKAFPNKIINIHPALLPKYGGKGMYGMNVHKAVVENKELQTGITIHYVNEEYDEGKVIFQATCPVIAEDTPESVAKKIHQLEYAHFPSVIEQLLIE